MNIAALLNTDPATLDIRQLPDAYKALNEVRLAMAKETEAVERIEKAYKDQLIQRLEKGADKGVYGLKYKAEIKSERVFQVDTQSQAGGWSELWGFIRSSGRWDLLQKRLNERALKDMYEAGEALPPGVLTLTVPKVSVTRLA